MKILIAEDDPGFRDELAKIFANCGGCDIARDGMEALDAYLQKAEDGAPYGLIFLDIMMPKLDGRKVLQAVRSYEQQRCWLPAKIVMLTAAGDCACVNESFLLGCDAYITKPLDADKFAEFLHGLGVRPLG